MEETTNNIAAPEIETQISTGGKKHAPIKLIRDLESTSGYWAAIWTMCVMPDAHVVVDAPIGCYNLIAQAVTDYTDAIADIDNVTPSTMREQEVTMLGTAGPCARDGRCRAARFTRARRSSSSAPPRAR